MSKTPSGRSQLTKRILTGVAIALVLVYIVFLFITTNFLGSNNIVTETAYRAKAYDIIESSAIVARDEDYLQSKSGGVLVYDVGDGNKVTAGGVIATAYASQEEVAAIQQIEELDTRIAFLEALSAVNSSANIGIDAVNGQINERLLTVLRSINARDFGSNMQTAESNLITSVLRKQLLTGEQGDISGKVEELKSQRDSLMASTGTPTGSVTSDTAGYFVSQVDGYEKAFDISKLDEITAEDVKNAKPAELDSAACIGKVIKDVNWYLLCPITADQATSLSHTDSALQVRLPSVVDEEIPAKLLYVNAYSNDDTAVAVLQCNYMSDALSKLRHENVEIIVNEYEGLKISKSALHDDNITYTVTDDRGNETEKTERVQGVYVEYGAELVFRQVAITYSGDDYIICNENPGDGVLLNGYTVSLYDKIVIEGGDLFDGKIIQ